jgi:multicomponent K+:H+ antiporter subunit E
MKRWLPHPWLSAILFIAWLVVSVSVAPLHVAGAVLVALGLPLLLARFDDTAPVSPRLAPAARLLAIVTWDIVLANVNVARLILGPIGRLRPAFVEVPLETPHPHVATLLAMIVTMTPGTVSSQIDEHRSRLLVHVLDAADPAAVVAAIKSRYERPLLEIFRCSTSP